MALPEPEDDQLLDLTAISAPELASAMPTALAL
jgi:hypothetical protein